MKAKKKRGPPPTGKGTQIGMRWHEPLLKAIDAWAAAQEDKPPRSEAIRRLVERQLASEGMSLPRQAPVKPTRASKPVKSTPKTALPKKTATSVGGWMAS
jgi:hypothetical protein